MEKVSMLPTVTSLASASPLRSLELMMQEALESVTRLRCEVAELKTLAATLREEVQVSVVKVSSSNKQRARSVNSTPKAAEPDFDWEAWTRETRARIRGESLGDEQPSEAS